MNRKLMGKKIEINEVEKGACMNIREGSVQLVDGVPVGLPIVSVNQYLKDFRGYFLDELEYKQQNPDMLIYTLEKWMPVSKGNEGGLFYATMTMGAGKIGREFFMTQGHFHDNPSTSQFCWGIEGVGILLLMNLDRICKVELIKEGSLHYIPGYIAHRLINIGTTPLKVGGCWPSNAGIQKDGIEKKGFSVRVLDDEKGGFVIK